MSQISEEQEQQSDMASLATSDANAKGRQLQAQRGLDGFTLDTSGRVNLGKSAFPFHNEYVEWTDLDPFTQGYVEALFASHRRELGTTIYYASDQQEVRDARFSDLSPEALALILRDCGSNFEGALYPGNTVTGRMFWAARQRGNLRAFPPLTITLGDDGKVHLDGAS